MITRNKRLNSVLLVGTALGSAMLLFSASAATAQSTVAGNISSIGTNGAGGTTITNSANTTDITLGNSKTILNWSGFNLGNTGTLNFVFGGRSDIVLNRVGGASPATINGVVNGSIGVVGGTKGGNVWFSSANGVVFGPNAAVNVGGLLATTGSIADSDFFGGNFHFSGAPSGTQVQVQTGAQLKASGGHIALIAPTVSMAAGSSIGDLTPSSKTDVMVGAAEEYTITFAPDSAGDLDLVSWTVPAASVGTGSNAPIDLNGSIQAGNVYIAAVNKSSVLNVIAVGGVVTATGAAASGDGNIVLSAGGGISGDAPSAVAGGGKLQAGFTNALTASGNVALAASGLTVNGVNGSRDVSLDAGTGLLNGSGAAIKVARHYSASAGDFTGGALDPVFSGGGNNFTITDTAGSFSTGVRSALGTLTINATAGDVIVTGALSGANVSLGASGSISQNASGAITAGTLTANATTGAVDLDDTAHNVTTLGASGGATGFAYKDANGLVVGGPINSSGAVNVAAGGALAVNANVSAASGASLSASGNLTVAGVVDGGTGNVVLSAGPGASDRLTVQNHIITDGGGNIMLAAGGGIRLQSSAVNTNNGSATGVTTAAGDVTLNGAVDLVGTGQVIGDNIAFNGAAGQAVIGGVGTLTVKSASGATFGGSVNVGVLDVTGLSRLNGSVTTAGALSLGAVELSGTGPLVLTAGGSGNLTVGAIVDSDATPNSISLTAGSSGGRIFASSMGTLAKNVGDVSFNSATTLNGTVVSSGAVSFAGALDLAAGSHSVTGADVTFNGAVNAQNLLDVVDLSVAATGAGALDNVTFASTVGATTALDTLTVNGPTALNGSSYSTTVTQRWNGAVALAGSATSAFNGGPGAIVFNSTLNGASTANMNAGGEITLGGIVGGGTRLTALNTSGGGVTNLNGGQVLTTGGQSYSGSVVLGANTTLDAQSGGLVFNAPITGNFGLTLRTPADSFLNGAVNIASLSTDAGGNTRINNTAGVSTSGSQTYGDAILLGTDVTLVGLNGTFSTIAGDVTNRDLALNFSGTTSTLGGNLSNIRNLSVGGGGITSIAGTISTTGSQTYTDAISLTGNAVLNAANNSAVTFSNTVNGARDLTVNTGGATSLNGGVGGVTALTSLTTDAPGQTNLAGTITTSGAQSFGDNVLLTGNTMLAGTTGTFASLSGSGNDLALNYSGLTTINGANVLGVRNLTSGGGGTTTLSGTINTTGTQTYSDALSLAADTILQSSGSGPNGNIALGLVTGNGNSLSVIANNGATNIAFNGAASGLMYLAAKGGAITVNAPLNASMDILFNALVGNLQFGVGGQAIGQNVTLSTTADFINLAGSSAVVAANRWLVYASNPSTSNFGGLNSNNTAVWNTSYGALNPAVTGNRYVFTYQPTVTVSTLNTSKVYGTDLTGSTSGLYSITGLQAGVAGAFLGDTAATAFSGAPMIGSVGLASNATVAGGPYAITASAGSMAAKNGYALAFNNGGAITVTPKALTGTVTANNRTYDGTTNATGSVALNGVVAGDQVTASALLAFADKNAGNNKPVTISGGSLAGTDAGNYTLSLPASTLASIFQKAITGTVTANNRTYDGTTNATGSVALNGVVAGDQVTASALLAFADKNAGNNKPVTISGGSLAGTDAGNYTLSLPASTLASIFQKAITGTVTANNRTYDGTTNATGSVALNGVVAGDQVTASALLAFADKNAGNNKPVTISGGSLAGTDAGNYTLSLPASTLASIFQKAITGTVTANNRTYDGTTNATGSVALNGVVAGDQVTASALLAFADKNAGNNKPVTISGGSLAGTDAGNYTLSLPASTLASIFQKAITGTVTANNRTYDGTTNATGSVALNGVVAGDQVTASALLAFADKNAGNNKPVTISGGSLAGTDAGNYTLSLPASTLASIFQKAITGTVTANNRTYDGTTNATGSVALNGVVAGDQVTASALLAFADKNAGNNKPVTISGGSLAGTDAGNYTLSLPASTLASIFQKAITGTVTANNRTYDGTTNATGSVALNGVVAGDQVTASALLAFADKNAGNNKPVTISGGSLAGTDAGNYTLSLPASTLASIFQKAITGTVTANNRTYDGTTNATGSVALNGVVAGDQVTASALLAFADKNAGNNKPVTISGGSLAGTDAGNYTLSLPASTLASIFQKAITGTVTANNRTYDGTTNATGSVALNGVVAGDQVTASALLAFADKNAGNNKPVTISGGSLAGTDAGNYTLSLPASTLASIFQKAITGTVTANNRTYDGTTNATGSVALNGVVAGDQVTASALLAFADKNAGNNKPVTISGGSLAGTDAGNYTLSLPASTLASIFQKAITVTADPQRRDEGKPDPVLTYRLTSGSMVEGEALSGSLTREPGENAGDYAILQGTLAASDNYKLTYVGNTFVIDPAAAPQIGLPRSDIKELLGFLSGQTKTRTEAPLLVIENGSICGGDATQTCQAP